MSSLLERLERFRLVELARGVVGDALDRLEHDTVDREAFVFACIAAGWARTNVDRVLGDALPTAAPRAVPPAPKSETRRARILGPVRPRERVIAPVDAEPAESPATVHLPLARTDALPASARPRMLPGTGERRADCLHESDCLGRAAKDAPSARHVHCPPRCSFYAPPTFEQRLELDAGQARGNL